MTFPNPKNEKSRALIVFILCVLFLAIAFKVSGQVYTAKDIHLVLNRTDSLSRLELLTAKKFHKRLNEYRKEKGACELRWSDTLYIMAMNHNTWMSYNKTLLTHYETTNTAHFTGDAPKDRLDYVLETKTFGTSENCAWVGWTTGAIEKMAEDASLTAFNMLKDDKPHCAIMINNNNKVHGVHISYKGGYCTSEFYGMRLLKN